MIEHQVDRLVNRYLLHEDRGLAVTLYVLVEDEIDSRLTRQHFEHHFGGRITKLQRDLGVVASLQSRRHGLGSASNIDLGRERVRGSEARVLAQHRLQQGIRGIVVLAREILVGVGHNGRVPSVGLDAVDPAQGALFGGVDGEYAAVAGHRGIQLPGAAQGIRGRDQFLDRCFAPRREIQLVAQVVGIAFNSRGQFRHARFIVPAIDIGETLAVQLRCGTAHEHRC